MNNPNYIYDVYLNLNKNLYDFFEWNTNDKIIHVKKIPIIKVCEDTIKKLIRNKITIDSSILDKLEGKTELWNSSTKINYCSLFTDSSNIIAIQFDKKGNSIKKSCLFIDEELEILELIKELEEKCIKFKIIKKEKDLLQTRVQIKEEHFITNELKNMDNNKLSYIFYECFGKKETNKEFMLDKLNSINKTSKTYKNLYDILKFTSCQKK